MGRKNKGKKKSASDEEQDNGMWENLGGLDDFGDLGGMFDEGEQDEDEEEEEVPRGRRKQKQGKRRRQNTSRQDGIHEYDNSDAWGDDACDNTWATADWSQQQTGYDWPQQPSNNDKGGWNTSDWSNAWHASEATRTQNGIQWEQQNNSSWGEDYNPDHQGKGKKKKGGKGKGMHAGDTWGNSIDHDAMQRYHQVLTQSLSSVAPPPKGTEWRTPLPSRTLKIARNAEGVHETMIPEAPGSGTGFLRFVDSGGAALIPAERALYNFNRPSKDRFHWMFPPHKEFAVAECLNWIQHMSYGLVNLGILKFLETGERGALITNVKYRARKSPSEPAFDYITWTQANRTFDRTLQRSLAYYDPETQVVIFVFLLSESQNSMAIWRRKLSIPVTLRAKFGDAIRQRKAEIETKEMIIRIDDVPQAVAAKKNKITKEPQSKQMKKKWFRWAS